MKRFLYLLSLLTAAALIFPVFALADGEQTQTQVKSQVLLVCDVNNGRAGLEELIRACGKSVDSISESDYQTAVLSGYSALVTTASLPYRDAEKAKIPTICVGENAGPVDGVETAYLESAELNLSYGGHTQAEFAKSVTVAEMPKDGSLALGSIERVDGQTFAYAVIGKDAAYVPWYSADGLNTVMLGGLIRQYFDRTENPKGKMYVLIDEVYPFSDLDMLRQTADVFHDNGIPFIVRIMPVYDNLNYPAFQRYTQALLYVQSKGGSFVLHNALVREYEAERESLDKKMSRAKTAFADAGITLLDMEKPPYVLTIDDIQKIDASGQTFGNLPIDTMISCKLFVGSDELKSTVRQLNDCRLTISSYKAKFSIEDSAYVEKTIDGSYAFRTITIGTLKGFFSGVNSILIIIVGLGLVIFVLLLIAGNRIYWRKFYRK